MSDHLVEDGRTIGSMANRHLLGFRNDNRGLSLVELIIAISIGVIISGAVAALITFAVRTYHDGNANIAAQYELQSNINQITDTIMGANCVVIQGKEAGSTLLCDTHYAAFGKYSGGNFEGVVFVAGPEYPTGSGRFNIYMDRGTWAGSTAALAVSGQVTTIEGAMPDPDPSVTNPPNQYLLGEGATQFRIELKRKSPADATYPFVNVDANGYSNPLSVEVELNFQKDAAGKVVNKHVKDEALIRNKLSSDIYIDGYKYSLIIKE